MGDIFSESCNKEIYISVIAHVYYTSSIANLGPVISVCTLKGESNRLCCCERYLQAVVHLCC